MNDVAPTSNPLGEAMAQTIDTSVNRRIGPIRRAVKALLDTVKGHGEQLAGIRKEVDALKQNPPVDPARLLAEAVGSAAKTLESLDAEAVKEIEKELSSSAPEESTSELLKTGTDG